MHTIARYGHGFALDANMHFMSHSATLSGLMLKLPPDSFPTHNASIELRLSGRVLSSADISTIHFNSGANPLVV